MNTMSHPAARTVEDMATESFWLKEAKATLRARDPVGARDPVDAALDADALAQWADLRCGEILQTATDQGVALQGGQNG